MLINEDYFKDLEIEDEDIIEDDTLDVEEPEHEGLTLEELHKLHKQYNHWIDFQINVDVSTNRDTTFIQTSLLPKLFKRLDTIFEMYGIEDYKYVLTSCSVKDCDTIVEFGNYQLFCGEWEKDKFINNTYNGVIFINVFVNYLVFNYKRAFRFVYTVVNLYRNCKQNGWMNLTTTEQNIKLEFWVESDYIEFHYYNTKTKLNGNEINYLII